MHTLELMECQSCLGTGSTLDSAKNLLRCLDCGGCGYYVRRIDGTRLPARMTKDEEKSSDTPMRTLG